MTIFMELKKNTLKTLKVKLVNWEDPDSAAYGIACCLGIIPQEDGVFLNMSSVKATFWGANPVGDLLYKFLHKLVTCGVLEYDEENEEYRWNNDFKL
jgi:hypothetical protein